MQSKKLEVRCECGSDQVSDSDVEAMKEALHAPSLEETLAIIGAASFAVHGINPFPQRSPIQSKPCAKCEGRGFINVANGPDDFDKEECGACNGTGRVVANN